MGKFIAGGIEEAPSVLAGTLDSVAASAAIAMLGLFNVFVKGTTFTGSYNLERSFDGGTTWYICGIDAAGNPATYTGDVSLVVNEPEPGVLYRINATTVGAGSIAYRLSGGERLS